MCFADVAPLTKFILGPKFEHFKCLHQFRGVQLADAKIRILKIEVFHSRDRMLIFQDLVRFLQNTLNLARLSCLD